MWARTRRAPGEPPHEPNERSMGRHAAPLDGTLDRGVGDSRPAPAIERAVNDPDRQEREDARENHVGEEMRAEGYAQDADGAAEGDRRRIGKNPDRRRRKSRRRERPERARCLACNERAIMLE